jgi:c-di-GMP-binding flagellar brake protein YcgR
MASVSLPQFSEHVGVRPDESGQRLQSRVEDVQPTRLLLATPTDGEVEIQLESNAGVAVEWVTPRGLARVAGRTGDTTRIHVPTVSIEVLGRPEIFQRREYVRAAAAIHLEATVPGVKGDYEGMSVDLSGGGIRATLPELDVEEGAELDLWIGLPDRFAEAKVRVLRRQDPDVYVLIFEEIAERDRERVIHLVFEKLRTAAWTR